MNQFALLIITKSIQAKIYEVIKDWYLLIQKINQTQCRLKKEHLFRDKFDHYQNSHKRLLQFTLHTKRNEEEQSKFPETMICVK